MNFTYYHGTSSLFLNSILNEGLGTVNPNIKHRNLDLLKFLYKLCEQHILGYEKYSPLIRDTTLAMVKQTSLIIQIDGEKRALNFKHEGVYVSLSEIRAVIHTVKNTLGSEILQRCLLLYNFLVENSINLEIPKELNYYNIETLASQKLSPILLKITSIPDSNLVQENDYDAGEFLNVLRTHLPLFSEKDRFEQFQYMNFRIINPIKSTFIKPYIIHYTGMPGTEEFSYSLDSCEFLF